MANPSLDTDDLLDLTIDDLRKDAAGDYSWFYRANDLLPDKPLGLQFEEYTMECMSNNIFPISVSERHPILYEMILCLATIAIHRFFGPDGMERPIKAILEVCAGGHKEFSYYITFMIDKNGKEETFQAQVYLSQEGTFNVPHCVEDKFTVKEGLLERSKMN